MHLHLIDNDQQEFSSVDLTNHGQRIDNGKRWCSVCDLSISTQINETDRKFANIICSKCNAVWPEYAVYVESHLMHDEEFVDSLIKVSIH